MAAAVPVHGVDTGLVSWVTSVVLPVPGGLAADLVAVAGLSDDGVRRPLRDFVPDPPGGLIGVEDAIARALSSRRRRPVDELTDPHHLADTDPDWAGGDTLRIRQLAGVVTPANRPAGARADRRRARARRRGGAHRARHPDRSGAEGRPT